MKKIRNELRLNVVHIAYMLFAINLVGFMIWFPFNFVDFSVVLGLFIGSVYSLLSFIHLTISSFRAVENLPAKANHIMRKGYLIRSMFFAVVFCLVIQSGFINILAFLTPMFVPKLYFLLIYSFVHRKEETS